jgi:hypothetical protein
MFEPSVATRRFLAVVLCGVLFFIACATTVSVANLSPEERDRIQTRKFDQPDSAIFSAVLECILDRGYAIQVCDKSVGLIQTAPLMYQPNLAVDILSTAIFGAVGRFRRTMAARVKDGVAKLNYTYETESKSGRLFGGESGWEPTQFDTSLSNAAYREAFDVIEANLTRRQAHGQMAPQSALASESPHPCTTSIANGTIVVRAIRYDTFVVRIAPGMSNARLTGNFMASGGKGSDIVVLVLGEQTFQDWSNLYGIPAERYLYSSGKVKLGSFDVSFPSEGKYYLVCSNTFSSFADKHVMIRANLSYFGQEK